MAGEYDVLFEGQRSGTSWWDGATREQQEWVDGLALQILQRGREPCPWARVHEHFVEKFGDDVASETTVRKWTRKRVTALE